MRGQISNNQYLIYSVSESKSTSATTEAIKAAAKLVANYNLSKARAK
jgi:hypothetical protein